MTSVVERARDFAREMHGEQVRRYTGEPYWHHLERVAQIVEAHGASPEVVAAAWLHDTLEDTDATFAELWGRFGGRVAALVAQLTDVFTPLAYPHMNRAARKAAEAQRLQHLSEDARLIKLADITDNAADIEKNGDDAFASLWLEEKKAMLRWVGGNTLTGLGGLAQPGGG